MATETLDFSSQRDFYHPEYHGGSVVIVGAGGIGSSTMIGLTRLGVPKIHIYDDDVVEPRNVTCQHFQLDDIGKNKAETIAEFAQAINKDADISHYDRRINGDDNFIGRDIVISAVDSMESRKAIYDAAIKSPTVKYLIDGRLGGQLIVCYNINIRNNEDIEYYLSKDVMFEDSEMESEICTARTICDVGYAVSALIIRSVRRILTGQDIETLTMLNMDRLELTTY